VTITAVSESRLLRNKIELVLPVLLRAGRRLFDHPRITELYPEYLFMSHCIIRASVPLMERARHVAQALPDDDVAAIVAEYLGTHIEEERHHDDWLLEDLAALGIRREEVLTRPPSAIVAAFVGAQYYWIEHYHPVALLGYVTLLEGYPPVASEIEQLQRRTGFGPDAFRTLSLHGELDPHHGEELDEVLDSLPLTEQQRTALGLSAISSVQHMTEAVEEVLERAT
jgi:pyrroloquinoline quinone (PQQ) biosynthesis protein C